MSVGSALRRCAKSPHGCSGVGRALGAVPCVFRDFGAPLYWKCPLLKFSWSVRTPFYVVRSIFGNGSS